jgi:hypothetical protein
LLSVFFSTGLSLLPVGGFSAWVVDCSIMNFLNFMMCLQVAIIAVQQADWSFLTPRFITQMWTARALSA